MRHRGSTFLAAALALTLALVDGSPSSAAAQTTGDSVSGATIEAPGSEETRGTPTGLPRRVPVPRTMEAHWPVFGLFAASWIGIVGYLLVAGRRAGRLTRRLREVEERR